ncbi:MAG: hypothetical protein WBF88_14850 [Pusillimonas sp.]
MADSILAAPLGAEWLAHRFDEATGDFRFVAYDRAERGAVPFLTDDHLPERSWRTLSRREAQAIHQRAPVHFIFHSGFCCSTLLASCFDLPGLASAFSEPMILNDIVGWRLRGAPPDAVGATLTDALHLLGRPFPGDQAAIVKPSSVVNGLGAAMLAIQSQARAVVMHAPLGDFLISIAKKGLDGRHWVRELFVRLRSEGRMRTLGFTDVDFLGQTDLQIAAMAWLSQQAIFAELVARTPDRVRSLDSATFMAAPDRTVAETAGHFGLVLTEAQLVTIRKESLVRDSKSGRRFTAADRKKEYERMHALHGDEIDKVIAWTKEVAVNQGLTLNLAAPLLPDRP